MNGTKVLTHVMLGSRLLSLLGKTLWKGTPELNEGAEVPESVEEVKVTEVHAHVPRGIRPEEVYERSSVITAMGGTSENNDAEVSRAVSDGDRGPLLAEIHEADGKVDVPWWLALRRDIFEF